MSEETQVTQPTFKFFSLDFLNLILLGFGFMLVFSAFNTTANYSKVLFLN